MTERIFLFGASGHAKVVLDAARLQGYEVPALFDDDPARVGTRLLACPVLGGRDELLAWCVAEDVRVGLVSIGVNAARGRVAEWLLQAGMALSRVVHPGAILAQSASVGPGSVLLAGAVINADTLIGRNVIVNTGATVDHDCVIGDNVHIAPGCHVCGGVAIGTGTLVGAGSVVVPGISIGRNAVVGAGSTVIRDVQDGENVAGSPARSLTR
jgi:sugar O-acyltransferase (sialic acid O-acetyltransferase NeuD family)